MWWVVLGVALMLVVPVGLAAAADLAALLAVQALPAEPRPASSWKSRCSSSPAASRSQTPRRSSSRRPTASSSAAVISGTRPRRRKGVILFGLEFGSNRWACGPYVDYLRAAGYDIFTWEPRNQGDSEPQEGYDPLQWVTDREVADCRAAIEYLKKRPDADPRGIGLYGLSKGANAGLVAAADEPYVRCAVTDGAFAHYTTMVPYMRVWFSIYDRRRRLQGLFGAWYFGIIARVGVRQVGRERGVVYSDIERLIGKLSPRPLLMIHGGADTYIKPTMTRDLFRRAREPKELWIVEGAKHNQALQVAADEYKRRVIEFFDKHLATPLAA